MPHILVITMMELVLVRSHVEHVSGMEKVIMCSIYVARKFGRKSFLGKTEFPHLISTCCKCIFLPVVPSVAISPLGTIFGRGWFSLAQNRDKDERKDIELGVNDI